MALWADIEGERWLENPTLIIGNPKRKVKTMARRKAKRRGRKNSPRRRARRVRRNYAASGLIANPRRRRRARRRRVSLNPRRRRRSVRVNARRRYRRNPGLGSVMGIGLPPLDAVLFTGAGLVIPPVMTSYLMSMLPATITSSKIG